MRIFNPINLICYVSTAVLVVLKLTGVAHESLTWPRVFAPIWGVYLGLFLVSAFVVIGFGLISLIEHEAQKPNHENKRTEIAATIAGGIVAIVALMCFIPTSFRFLFNL